MSSWNTTNVQNMSNMFDGCIVFNQPLDALVVSNVTNMSSMFSGCLVFNQTVDSWNVYNVTDMNSMFMNCSNFAQPGIGLWNLSSLTNMTNMVTNTGMTPANFTQMLVNLNSNVTLPKQLSLGTTNLTYYSNVELLNLSSMQIAATSIVMFIYSGTCFHGNTPINTDQGIIQIDQIDPLIHTIRKRKIIAITKTISQDKHIIQIEKDAFDVNIPSITTVISNNHKIMYRGKMIRAQDFIGFSDKIKKIKYNGEVLYNVLLEDHGMMITNNLIVETLHPDHRLAKLYNTFHFDKMDTMQQIYVIEELNKIVLEKQSSQMICA